MKKKQNETTGEEILIKKTVAREIKWVKQMKKGNN